MTYSRREPREPEAQHHSSMEASVGAMRRRPRLDPPAVAEPNISLSERQLELLSRRQQAQEQQNYSQELLQQPQQPLQQVKKRRGRDPSVVDHHQNNNQQSAWMRTPNPISRPSDLSITKKTSSPTYLNQILKKAMSSSSSHGGWANSNSSGVGSPLENSGKRSLKKVLAKRVLRNKKAAAAPPASSPPAPSSKPSSPPKVASPEQEGTTGESTNTNNNSSSFTLRERLRRARKEGAPVTPSKKQESSAKRRHHTAAAAAATTGTKPQVNQLPPPPPPPPPPPNTDLTPSNSSATSRSIQQQAVANNLVVKHQRRQKESNENKSNKERNVEEGEPDGYRELYKILKTECFQTNSLLWTSFQAVIKGEDVPLPRVISHPKPFKFDAKTTRTLMTIHDHLKANEPVEVLSRTQLVNDKKYSKEVASQLPSLAASSSSTTTMTTTGSELSSLRSDLIMNARSSASAELGESHSINNNGNIYYGRNSPLTSREADDAILNIRTALSAEGTTSQSSQMNHHRPTTNGSFDVDLEKNKAGGPGASSSASSGNGVTAEDTGLEITLGQFKSGLGNIGRPSTSTTPLSGASSDSLPWAGIKLKPSIDSLSSMNSATQLSSPVESLGSLLPEWASMKLRQVKRSDSETILVSELSEASEMGKTSNVEPGKKGDDVTTLFSSLPSTKSAEVASSENEAEPAPPSQPEEITAAKISRRGKKIDEEAVIVPLKNVPGTSKTDVVRVVIGKQMLMGVKSKDGNPKSQVLWKLPREEIDSLAMDMATMKINLIMVGKDKPKTLSFAKSDDCLSFANAFYEQVKKKAPGDQLDEIEPDHESIELADSAADDSFRLESLNEEEQNVLETYRRLRRTKGAEDALEASIPSDTTGDQPSNDQTSASVLSPDEEETATVYRKMLQMGVPFEGVEHKMKKDNVDEKIIVALSSNANMPPRFVAAGADPSSPVSAMSTSIGLSVSDVGLVEEYKKMLRLKIQPEAVKHKMLKDQIDQKIISAVFGEDEVEDTVSKSSSKQEPDRQLSEEEERIASSFRKMLKLKFPEEVVRHRMKKEEVDEKIVAAVFSNQNDETKSSPENDVMSAAEEEVAEKYRKMLKLCIPKEAIRHKMTRDQVDPRIIDRVIGCKKQEKGTEATKEPSATAPADTQRKQLCVTLSFEEESVASNYRKMLKLQVPKERVLTRMQQDGVSDKVITAVVGNKSVESNSKDCGKDSVSGGSKLVSLHWTPLSGKELDNSVWRVNSKLEDSETQPETSDISKLIELFQKKTAQKRHKDKKDDEILAVGKAKLLDLTRSNNVAISLKAFKDFSFKDLADRIAYLDPTHKITGERTLFLRGLLPTVAEIKAIKAYQGGDDRLIPAELWFRQIVAVKRLEEKVHVMQTMEMFRSDVESLCDSFRLLLRVCNQVLDSEKLQTVLGMVLRIGNIMNEGTRTGGAAGFKFDSLLRLTQTKSSDGKTTVLDFLVTVLVEKGQRSTLDLLSDFPECHNASRMAMGDLLGEVKELKASLEKCRVELQMLEDEADGKNTNKKTTRKFGSEAGSTSSIISEASSAALIASVLARGQTKATCSDDPSSKPKSSVFAKREDFLAAVKEKSSGSAKQTGANSDKDSAVLGKEKEVSKDVQAPPSTEADGIRPGIARLKQFIDDGGLLFNELEGSRKNALDACRELSRYCGEGEGTGATSTLLSILAEFASKLESALKKYDAKQAAEARKRRKKCDDTSTLCSSEESKSTSSKSASSNSTVEAKDSLVLLTHSMLKQANERTREDFKKGRVYPDPSSKLKAIYERESTASVFGSPNTGRRKLDIVSAIRENEESIDHSEDQKARSRFGDLKKHDGPKPESNPKNIENDSDTNLSALEDSSSSLSSSGSALTSGADSKQKQSAGCTFPNETKSVPQNQPGANLNSTDHKTSVVRPDTVPTEKQSPDEKGETSSPLPPVENKDPKDSLTGHSESTSTPNDEEQSSATLNPVDSSAPLSEENVPQSSVSKKRAIFENMFSSPERKPQTQISSQPEKGLLVASPPKVKRWQTDTLSVEKPSIEPLPKRSLEGRDHSELTKDAEERIISNLPDAPISAASSENECSNELNVEVSQGKLAIMNEIEAADDIVSHKVQPSTVSSPGNKEGEKDEVGSSDTPMVLPEKNEEEVSKNDSPKDSKEQPSENSSLNLPPKNSPRSDQKKYVPRLSEARKRRSMLEKIVSSTPPPIMLQRDSSPIHPKVQLKTTSQSSGTEDPRLDTSASENRLMKSEPVVACSSHSPVVEVSKPSNTGTPNSNRSNVEPTTMPEDHRATPIRGPTSPRSLSEKAKQKRLDRATKVGRTSPITSSNGDAREALVEVSTVANQLQATEHSILRMARQKREAKSDALPKNDQEQQQPSSNEPSAMALLARKKREQKRTMTTVTTNSNIG